MNDSLYLEMLPVGNGDALWLEYGLADARHRILVDGGPAHTYDAVRRKILSLDRKNRHFELLVITHIDLDHIDGIIRLLQDISLGVTFSDIWFNGWKHVNDLSDDEKQKPEVLHPDEELLGPQEGEFLGALLEAPQLPWNLAFDGGPVVVPVSGDLPNKMLQGNLRITLLSPGPDELTRAGDRWQSILPNGWSPGDREHALRQLAAKKKLQPPTDEEFLGSGVFAGDNRFANGSSIAMIVEWGGRRLLLAADAFPRVLSRSIRRLGSSRRLPLQVDGFKIPHHGSRNNLSIELLELIDSPRYLISTSGAGHGHPHDDAIQLILDHAPAAEPELCFNYLNETAKKWAAKAFTVTYPKPVTSTAK